MFTPDGTLLATPTSDGTRLWDTRDRELVDTLATRTTSCSTPPSAPTAAGSRSRPSWRPTTGVSGRLQVWDLSTRELDRVVESPAAGSPPPSSAPTANGL